MTTAKKLFIVADDLRHASIDTTAFNDATLSFKAMGIHAYIRTRPHGTITTMPDLQRSSVDGEHAIRSGIKELVQKKYLYLIQLRRETGKMGQVAYISFPSPTRVGKKELLQLMENYPGSPHGENHQAVKPLKKRGRSPKNPVNSPHGENHKAAPKHVLNYNLTYYNSPNGELNKLNYNNNSARAGVVSISQKKKSREFEKAEQLFDFWNSLPNTPTHKKNGATKVYKRAMFALLMVVKHYPMKTIQAAMEAYDRLLVAPGTIMRNRQTPFRVGLDQFFKFQEYTNQLRHVEDHPLREIKNWFTECRKGDAYLLDAYTQVRRDKNRRLTKMLTEAAVQHKLLGSEEPTIRQKNTLIQAGCKMREFLDRNSKLFPPSSRFAGQSPETACVTKLFTYLGDIGKPLHLGYLISDITWGNLKSYMTEMGAIVPKDNAGGFRSIRDALRS